MSVLADLEAALRASWSYDDLAVYADHLQAAGDPRGELIGLDLAAPRDRFGAAGLAWRERRRAVIAAWVGPALVDEVDAACELGFVKQADARTSPALLASPAGDVIRAFVADARDGDARAALGALAARPRPWLARHAIAGLDDLAAVGLAAATPALAHLALTDVARPPAHPTVRYLEVAGGPVPACPGAVHLDLAPGVALPALVLDDTTVPALAALELARVTSEQPAVFAAIAAQPAARGLGELGLPALADDEAVDAAERLLDALPALARARVAPSYDGAPGLGARLRPRAVPIAIAPAVPWPAPAALRDYDSLVFRIPEETYDDVVALRGLVAFLERHNARFADDARAAWAAIFAAARPREGYYDEVGETWIDPPAVTAPTLAVVTRAIDACAALDTTTSRSFAEFRTHLRHAAIGLSPTTPIEVARYRG